VIPSEHFNTVTYTGDGASTRSVTGVGFQPDFTWVKKRFSATINAGHSLFDIVNGTGSTKGLYSHSTVTEGSYAKYGYLSAFDSDGFTVNSGSDPSYPLNMTNANNDTYVAWNWKAGGASVTNTTSDITSEVSANQAAGISIVTWSGNGGLSAQTIGHGLGVVPEMMIRKRLDDDNYWYVWHKGLTSYNYELYLNDTNAQTAGGFFQFGAPNNGTYFRAYDGGSTTDRNVTYCFASVDGYSKVGSYTGNGSADGTFVYTGFRPAYVIGKRSSGIEDWFVFDSTRNPTNAVNGLLYPNGSNAEYTGVSDRFDMYSNGFKLRDTDNKTNASGSTYIYLAFAETPFKHSNAR
jgi:hypothetical protein